jgi:putative FmdB family regulatory protein
MEKMHRYDIQHHLRIAEAYFCGILSQSALPEKCGRLEALSWGSRKMLVTERSITMPTYEFICSQCNERFERFQPMSATVPACPACGGEARRMISPGAGVITKDSNAHGSNSGGCSFESTGTTCCGSSKRCSTPGCGEK